MVRPGRLADRFNRWAIARGFPLLAWLAPRWPRWLLFANARWIIALVMALYSGPKAEIDRNFARILGLPPRARAVRRARRAMLRHFAYYWVDLFRFPQLPPLAARRLIASVRGLERVEALREAGRPVLLLTAHLGNWELGGVLLGQRDWPVAVVYVADQFADAEAHRSRLRGLAQVEQIAIRPHQPFASLPVLRAIREGRMVALQGDRDFDGQGEAVAFFGAPARFPTGPFHLARTTGAALVPTFLVYNAERRFAIEFGEPIEVPRTGDRDQGVRRAQAAWVAVLEAAVARWPTQWYTFFDFWRAGEPARAAPAEG